MKTRFFVAAAFSLLAGCGRRMYEIDFSEASGFQWNGKLKITQREDMYLGPLLTMGTYWTTDRIVLQGRDGRAAIVDPDAYHGAPLASISLPAPGEMQILGTKGVWDRNAPVLIADPEAVACALQRGTTQSTEPAETKQSQPPFTPTLPRPYAEHVDELSLVDWWWVALNQSDFMTVKFELPEQKLQIIMSGHRREYGPEVLKVRTADGELLKRFERELISPRKLSRAADSGAVQRNEARSGEQNNKGLRSDRPLPSVEN